MATKVKIETVKGTMIAELYDNETPITVNNFKKLIGEGFYDGLTQPRGKARKGKARHQIRALALMNSNSSHFLFLRRGSLSQLSGPSS